MADIITVCLNEYDGLDKNNTPSRCATAKNRLKSLDQFRTSDNEIKIVDNDKLLDTPKVDLKSVFGDVLEHPIKLEKQNTESNFYKWFSNKIDTEKLLVTLDTESFGDHENLYYFPAIIGTLSRLLTQFPLWSNIMKNIYDSNITTPSSSNVEAYFKNIKRLLLQMSTKSHRLRTDEFISKHLEFLKGEIKVAANKLAHQGKVEVNNSKDTLKKVSKTLVQKRKLQTNEEFTDDSIFAENPTFIENWRGKGKDVKKRKRKLKSIVLLSNGSRLQIGDKKYILRNTCAMDSLCQALAIAYVDDYRISRTIQDSKHLFCKLIRLMTEKNTEELYKVRSEMAQVYFNKVEQANTVEISCECNVNNVFERILIDCIYSADEREHCTELECPINNVQRKIPVLHIDVNKTVKELQEAANTLINCKEITQCRRQNCHGIKSFTIALRDLIAFEFNSNDFISVDDPPIHLLLHNTEFRLLSIIEFIPPTPGIQIGHYKAHCRRNLQWNCYDDQSTKITKSQKKMIPHCILYVKK